MRTDMNPALAPRRGYVEIPVLGGLNISENSNFLCLSNFLYPDNGRLVSFMHGSVSTDKFLRRLSNDNFLDVDTRVNIVGFGNHARRYYWNFGWNIRVIGGVNLPKDVFRFLKTASAGNYDLKRMSVYADAYSELGLGFSFPVLKDVVDFGFKVKALVGLAQAKTDFDYLALQCSPEKISGSFSGRVRGNIAGLDPVEMLKNSNFKYGGVGNIGGAVDLGVNVHLLHDRLRVSAAVVDLGFIRWSNRTAVKTSTFDCKFEYLGYDMDKEEFAVEYTKEFQEIEYMYDTGYSRRLNTTLNIGAEYNILRDRISFGLLSSTRFAPAYTTTELTASVNFRPAKWFGFSVSHSLVNNKLGVVGAALNFDACWINLFLGMDYMAFRYGRINGVTVPLNSKSTNLYFGLAIPMRTHQKAVDKYEFRMSRKAGRAARRAF